MEVSLYQIINRLQAMKHDQSDDVQIRSFSLFGIELCQVSYSHITGIYTIEVYASQQHFEFDNLDLTAIEIYELLTDLQKIF